MIWVPALIMYLLLLHAQVRKAKDLAGLILEEFVECRICDRVNKVISN
jgi:hypothetical protein